LKICIVTSSFPLDEQDVAGPFIPPLISELAGYGLEITVFTQDRGRVHRNLPRDVRVVTFPWRGGSQPIVALTHRPITGIFNLLTLFSSGIWNLAKLRRATEFDLYLCCWAVPSAVYLYFSDMLTRKPSRSAVWCLGSDVRLCGRNVLGRSLFRILVRRAWRTYADGLELADQAAKLSGIPFRFLPSGRKLAMSPHQEEKPGLKKFLFVGRMEKVKGVDVLVDAATFALEQKNTPFEITIVGDGALAPSIQARVDQSSLRQHIQFRKNLSLEELSRCYDEAGCVVICSRSESIPLVLGEAAQRRKPLIVTQVGDMGTLVERFGLGIAVPPEDPVSLAEAMLSFQRGELLTRPDAFESVTKFLNAQTVLEELVNDLKQESQR